MLYFLVMSWRARKNLQTLHIADIAHAEKNRSLDRIWSWKEKDTVQEEKEISIFNG
jgi:hypothetical protein